MHKGIAALLIVITISAATAIVLDRNMLFPPAPPTQTYEPSVPSANQKVVCIVFDDGWKTHLDTLPILANYNFTATYTIITSYVGYPAYMNWADILNVAQKGNDIVSHTQTHCNLSSVNETTLQAELANSQQALRLKGYAADVLIYPYGEGANNLTVRNEVAKYYLVAGGLEEGKCNFTSFDRYDINSYGIYRNTTLTDFASYLNGTQGGAITILYYHKISDENVDTAIPKENFQTQMQYLKDNNFTVRTISEEFLKQAP